MRATPLFVLGSLLLASAAPFALHPMPGLAQIDRYPEEKPFPKPDDEGPRLPNGKLQRDAILKHEHQRSLEDLREIHRLSGELIAELEEDTAFVLSLKSVKKLERLEKLSKDVRKRIEK
ncbi:MAG: hypothetical protein KJZ70_03985 [Bryobacterales bacterium]|nr:hypothetical protein [Bryobacterales bacterium]